MKYYWNPDDSKAPKVYNAAAGANENYIFVAAVAVLTLVLVFLFGKLWLSLLIAAVGLASLWLIYTRMIAAPKRRYVEFVNSGKILPLDGMPQAVSDEAQRIFMQWNWRMLAELKNIDPEDQPQYLTNALMMLNMLKDLPVPAPDKTD